MNQRHIHAANLALRYGDGIPTERPRDGYAGGGRGWVRSPLARAIADREKNEEPVPYRKRGKTPQRGTEEHIKPPAPIHPGWGMLQKT
jgi:hypothetical protein